MNNIGFEPLKIISQEIYLELTLDKITFYDDEGKTSMIQSIYNKELSRIIIP